VGGEAGKVKVVFVEKTTLGVESQKRRNCLKGEKLEIVVNMGWKENALRGTQHSGISLVSLRE
jgi:hypothetical protein